VLMIIAVLLTMVTVSLSGATGGVAVRESAANLLSSLRYARYYAAIHGCEVRVKFLREANSCELTCKPDADQDQFEPLPGGRTLRLADHVRFSAIVIPSRNADAGKEEGDIVTFQPTGECDGASIELTDERMIYTLSISPSTGLVRLHKGPAIEIPNDREDLDAT